MTHTQTSIYWGKTWKNNQRSSFFNSSDSHSSCGILRGLTTSRPHNTSSSPPSLQQTCVKVKTLVSYWHKCFTPDFKSTKLLLDKHHHHKSLILHHPTSPVLHVLEKLRYYWSLRQQNHNVNSARIQLNHLEILRINSIKSMTPDLLVLSRWAICQWEHFVKCQTKSKLSVPYWGGGCRTRQRTATSGRSRFFLNLGVWSECHSDWCLG